MKNIVKSILVAGSLGSAIAGGAASAQQRHAPDTTLASFSDRVSADVGRSLAQGTTLESAPARSGTATIAFKANPDGTSRLVTLARSSGNSGLDRRAMRAVRRLSSLSPMPPTLNPDQRFSMTVLFAGNTGFYSLERKRQLANARLNNRWFTTTEGKEVAPIRAR